MATASSHDLPPLGVWSNRCWVCDRLLLDEGGDPSCMRNQHHVIPQAFGGKDGPTVSIDSAHHDLLHLVANKMLSGKPWENLVANLTRVQKARVVYLATRVVVASNFALNDPNKKLSLTVSVNKAQNERVKALADLYKCSRNDLLLRLVDAEYIRRFQPRK